MHSAKLNENIKTVIKELKCHLPEVTYQKHNTTGKWRWSLSILSVLKLSLRVNCRLEMVGL